VLNSIIELLKVTAVAHGNAKQSVAATFTPDGIHTTTWIEEQKQAKRLSIKTEYLGKMLSIHDRLRVEGDAVLKSIGRIKYPVATHPLESSRIAGEAQLQTAFLFLQAKPSPKTVLSSVEEALAIGRTDYAWTIINAEKARIASRSASVMPDASDTALLRGMSEIVARWDLRGELSQLEAEKELIPAIRERAESFERFIQNEHLTGQFVPRDEIESMTESEVGANLESVNWSMSDAVA
jgi:hypothetical protein